ncbi:MAG: aldolase/citrate lyase family protein [Planctomycetaceae bacterium]
MRPVHAYPFLPARAPALMRRLLGRLPVEGVWPVLDLEDAVADTLEPERTPALKAAARGHLEALLADGYLPACSTIGVRVNGRGTPYHEADMAAVAQLRRAGVALFVVLPKVGSAADVAAFDAVLAEAHAPVTPVVPTLETGAGVRRAREIAAAGAAPAGLVVGIIDYALDQGLWPFPDAFDPIVWRVAEVVSEAALSRGIPYIHPPCLSLRDAGIMRRISARVLALPAVEANRGVPPGIASLGAEQTLAIVMGPDAAAPSARASVAPPVRGADGLAAARHIVEVFQARASGKRSFSVDDVHDRFIPPQEYQAAVRVVEAAGGGR